MYGNRRVHPVYSKPVTLTKNVISVTVDSRENVILDKELVSAIFENATHQGDALMGLYRLVYPDWDNIASVDGFPKVNDATWKYICLKFQTLDAKYHPDVLPGGAWLNNGFSGDHGYNPELPDFCVIPAPVTYLCEGVKRE